MTQTVLCSRVLNKGAAKRYRGRIKAMKRLHDGFERDRTSIAELENKHGRMGFKTHEYILDASAFREAYGHCL